VGENDERQAMTADAKMARLRALTIARDIINEHLLTAGKRLKEEMHLDGDDLEGARCAYLVIIEDLRAEREKLLAEIEAEVLEGNPLQQ
jgi:hypothetical protein